MSPSMIVVLVVAVLIFGVEMYARARSHKADQECDRVIEQMKRKVQDASGGEDSGRIHQIYSELDITPPPRMIGHMRLARKGK